MHVYLDIGHAHVYTHKAVINYIRHDTDAPLSLHCIFLMETCDLESHS